MNWLAILRHRFVAVPLGLFGVARPGGGAAHWSVAQGEGGRILPFVNKKKQKNFIHGNVASAPRMFIAGCHRAKFFCFSLFTKRRLFHCLHPSLLPAFPPAAQLATQVNATSSANCTTVNAAA